MGRTGHANIAMDRIELTAFKLNTT